MMMKFDFHVHALLSKSIRFRIEDLYNTIYQARLRYLNGFALTEHLHSRQYWSIYRNIKKIFNYRNGVYTVYPGFYILNGAEISLKDGGDVIAIGRISAIKQIDKTLNINKGNRPVLEELLDVVPQEVILIGAHPFRPNLGLSKFDHSQLKRLTAIELNGKDFGNEYRVKQLSEELGLPLVCGSDTHFWPQVGVRNTQINMVRDMTLSNIKDCIVKNDISLHSVPDGQSIVNICLNYKSMVKKILGIRSSANSQRQKTKMEAVNV